MRRLATWNPTAVLYPPREAPVPSLAVAASAPVVSPARLHAHIPALDGVRGLAILLVMLFHFGYVFGQQAVGLPAQAYVQLKECGWIGVDLFFVLSGFLITGILLDTRGSVHYFRSFFMRRTLRVWPLYYGVLIVVFLVGPFIGASRLPGMKEFRADQGWLWLYAANFFLGFREDWYLLLRAGWLDMEPFWSLAVEEHFYLVWPFVVLFVARRWLAAVCVAGILVAMPIRYVLLRLGVPEIGIYVLTPCRMDALFLGAFLAVLVRRPGGPAALLWPARWALFLAALALVAVIYQDGGWMDHFGRRMQQVGYSAIALACGSVLVLALNARPEGPWQNLWTSAPLRVLGRYSYGLYVYHALFNKLLEEKLRPFYTDPGGTTQFPSMITCTVLSIVVMLILAVASYHLFELPFLRLKRYFTP